MDPLNSSYPTIRDTPGEPNTAASVRFPTVAGAQQAPVQDMSTLHVVVNPLLFGRYRRIRELGRGGMGVVSLAQDEVLGIPVALKLLPEEISRSPEELESLRKEVLRGIALTHSGIVRIFSFERDSSHTAIVMEYVDGESLSELKARQPGHCFDPDLIRPWLEQLCAVLDYAHEEARIAHRDLKPRNLMVTREGRLKVADFGIASSLSETMSTISLRQTAAGTPPYMSPQQARGERPSASDDIYSTGATMYDLLTGKPPFFRGDIMTQVLHEKPQPMNDRRAELGVTDRQPIPAKWERAIAACLAKDPSQRPPSGAALLELLDTPSHAMVPYAKREPAPLETIKLEVFPVAHPQPAREEQIVEAAAYSAPGTPWRESLLFSIVRSIFSAIGELFGILFVWARRLVIAAVVIALVVLALWIYQRLPKPEPKPAPAAAPAPAPPSPLAAPTLQQPTLQTQSAQPGQFAPPPPPPPPPGFDQQRQPGPLDRPPAGGPPPPPRRR